MAAAAAAPGQSDGWTVICHSKPTAFHPRATWDSQDGSLRYPAPFLKPTTQILSGVSTSYLKLCESSAARGKVIAKREEKASEQERGFTQNTCAAVITECFLCDNPLLYDQPVSGPVVLITRNFVAF